DPALCGEANANELVGSLAAMTPQATDFAGQRVVVFAGPGTPGASAAIAATNFDHVRALRVHAGNPVKSVAAKIHDATAGIAVSFERSQHGGSPVFGVAARQDDFVLGKQRLAFQVQIFIRGDVKVESFLFQPIGEVQVGGKMAWTAEQPHDVAG